MQQFRGKFICVVLAQCLLIKRMSQGNSSSSSSSCNHQHHELSSNQSINPSIIESIHQSINYHRSTGTYVWCVPSLCIVPADRTGVLVEDSYPTHTLLFSSSTSCHVIRDQKRVLPREMRCYGRDELATFLYP